MLGLIQILGGVALFLYGNQLLSSGIEKLTGSQIQKMLDRATSNRFKSMLFGTGAAALVQSSTLLMVTMIGLINANLMTVEQSIGVMLGQEIGTTITGQLVAFDIGAFRLVMLVIGLVFLEFFPKRDWKKFGEIAMGLGLLFIGIDFMSGGLGAIVEFPWVKNSIVMLSQYPWLGVVVGTVLAALAHSSAVVTSLVIAMGISGVINLSGAIGIILGANIGTCVTGLFASLRLSPTARQASYAQIIINISGVAIFLPFLIPFADLVQKTSDSLPRQIANAHTIFNLTVSLLLFPFVKQIAAVVQKLAPFDPSKEKKKVTEFIDENQFAVPSVALNEAGRELTRLGKLTVEMVELSCLALLDENSAGSERVISMEEKFINPVTDELEDFLNRLMREELSFAQQKRALQIKTLLVDIERVGDMSEDIAQIALEKITEKIPFSIDAKDEFEMLWRHVFSTYQRSIRAFEDSNRELAKGVIQSEEEFDDMYLAARQRHIQRVEAGVCAPRADIIFTELLRTLERISDHADNIGESVLSA